MSFAIRPAARCGNTGINFLVRKICSGPTESDVGFYEIIPV